MKLNHLFIISALLLMGAIANAAPSLWLGNQKALVLPMSWSDIPPTNTEAEIEKVFFQLKSPSLRQFFLENSSGKFDITGSVLKWKASSLKWRPNNGCDPNYITREAWSLFKNEVNIADYDSDHDGKIDHLFILHSGRIPSDRVGPSCMFGQSSMANQTIVFQTQGVGSIGSQIPIGFYVHEAGHQLFNFPDLYADHYHGKYGIGMWGTMGLGAWGVTNTIPQTDLFRYPSHFEPMSKAEIGWVKPTLVKQSQVGVTIRPVELSGDVIAIPISPGSFYFLEFRSPMGFSQGHRGHGLMIWKNYTLMQADGRDDINHGHDIGHRPLPPIDENFGDESDSFPGSMNITRFEDKATGIAIENIMIHEGVVTFDIKRPNELGSFRLIRPIYEKFDGIERL